MTRVTCVQLYDCSSDYKKIYVRKASDYGHIAVIDDNVIPLLILLNILKIKNECETD